MPTTQDRQRQQYLLNPDISNQLEAIRTDIKRLQTQAKTLENLYGACVTLSDLGLSENRTKQLIADNSEQITKNQEKLSLVSLPEDTRYYLEESEIEDFRSNFQKLVAMMTDVQNLYDSMVAYVSNISMKLKS